MDSSGDFGVVLPEAVCPTDSPFRLTRLNGDSSWLPETGHTRIVVDPWLKGVEIDYFPWFNTGWHSLPASRYLFLPIVPIYAANGAAGRLRKHFGAARTIIDVPSFFKKRAASETGDAAPSLACGELRIAAFPPPGLPDLTHGGLVLTTEAAPGCLVYAPHGLKPSAKQVAAIQRVGAPLTVMATSTRYTLPMILGGTVNMGLAAAAKLVGSLKAHSFIETHSEHSYNTAKGIVRRFSRTEYASPADVLERIPIAQFAATPTPRVSAEEK